MKFKNLKNEQNYYVKTCFAENCFSGFLKQVNGNLKLKLFDFDRKVSLPDMEPISVRTEENLYVCLYDHFDAGHGSFGYGDHSATSQHYFSNLGIVGYNPWEPFKRVKRCEFSIPGAGTIFRSSNIYSKIANSKITELPNRDLFAVRVSGAYIKAFLDVSATHPNEYPDEIYPRLVVEFENSVKAGELREELIKATSFFSACLSSFFMADEVCISALSEADYLKLIEKRHIPTDYSLYMGKAEYNSDSDRSYFHGAFALLVNAEESKCFNRCLEKWYVRYDEWKKAAACMISALRQQNVISPERLLNSTRWFESTPGAKPGRVISKKDTRVLARILSAEADELGHSHLLPRLTQAFHNAALEPRKELIRKLVEKLRGRFGSHAVGDNLIDWTLQAFEFRGRAAHSTIDLLSENDHKLFTYSIYSVECLCYLLLIYDLPLSQEAYRRVHSSLFVEQYRLGVENSFPADFA